MRVELAYGRTGLSVDLPEDRTLVIRPTFTPGIRDEADAIRAGLTKPINSPPLREILSPADRVAISVCDVTRAIPSYRVLPPILEELERVPVREVKILIATGTHRACRPAELEEMLGSDVVKRYEVINHSAAESEQLKQAGFVGPEVPVWLNRNWLDSTFRITTGFVEPHFFAGFSGGPKMVAPGLAGLETILYLHSAPLIAHPDSTWGVVDSNPIHSAVRQIAEQTGVDFALDVTLNREQRITGVFAGELFAEHRQAVIAARKTAMRPVDDSFDIVVTTNSGYPLDQNLYQTVKGISAAARVVRPGGTIICVSECSDGIPDHGEYGRLLASTSGPDEILALVHKPGFLRQDQWQAQIQAQIQQRAEVYIFSEGLSPEQIRNAHLLPVDDLERLVDEKLKQYGADARICVLPEGPQTIPYLKTPQAAGVD